MTRINRIRLANVNYNNNHIHIEDKLFDLNSKDTLMVLANGGGKSVFVQLLSSLFVEGRYKNRVGREFYSYFTEKEPTYIMVEWELDYEGGYVLTGAMIRKNQGEDYDIRKLDQYNFVHEYRHYGENDIQNIDLYKTIDNRNCWKTFQEAKNMLLELDHDQTKKFNTYELPRKQRQYLDRLKEFKINHEEWETIMNPINKGESGLKNLFKDCKTERDLIERWFIPVIEQKQNVHTDKVKAFQDNLETKTKHLKKVQEKLKLKDLTESYIQKLQGLLEQSMPYEDHIVKIEENKALIQALIEALRNQYEVADKTIKDYEATLTQLQQDLNNVHMQQDAYNIYSLKEKLSKQEEVLKDAETHLSKIKDERDLNELKVKYCECNEKYQFHLQATQQLQIKQEEIDLKQQENKDLEPERKQLGYYLKKQYEYDLETLQNSIDANKQMMDEDLLRKEKLSFKQEKDQSLYYKQSMKIIELQTYIKQYYLKEDQFNLTYHANLIRNVYQELDEVSLNQFKTNCLKQEELVQKNQLETNNRITDLQQQRKDLITTYDAFKEDIMQKQFEYKQCEQLKETFDSDLKLQNKIIQELNLSESYRFKKDMLIESLNKEINGLDASLKDLHNKLQTKQKEQDALIHGEVIELDDRIQKEFAEHSIQYTYGMEWLRNATYSKQQKQAILKAHPFLPYALIMDQRAMKQLQSLNGQQFTSFPIPIVDRSSLEKTATNDALSHLYMYDGMRFYIHFNENSLDEALLQQMIEDLQEEIDLINQSIQSKNEMRNRYNQFVFTLNNQTLTKEGYETLKLQLYNLNQFLDQSKFKKKEFDDQLANVELDLKQCKLDLQQIEQTIQQYKQRKLAFDSLMKDYETYLDQFDTCQKLEDSNKKLDSNLKAYKQELDTIQMRHDECIRKDANLFQSKQMLVKEMDAYRQFNEVSLDDKYVFHNQDVLTKVKSRFEAINKQFSKELQQLLDEEKQLKTQVERAYSILIDYQKRNKIEDGVYLDPMYEYQQANHYQSLYDACLIEYDEAFKNQQNCNNACIRTSNTIENKEERYLSKYKVDTLLDQSEIYVQDFNARIHNLQDETTLFEEQIDVVKKRQETYKRNVDRLDAYNETSVERIPFNKDLAKLDLIEINDLASNYVNTQKQLKREFKSSKYELQDYIRLVEQEETFKQERFTRSLTHLQSTIEQELTIKEQLEQLIDCHQTILKTLQHEVENQMREKESFVKELLEYVRDMNLNMQKIDSASNIEIEGRNHKLLMITTPDFDENKETYLQKLTDYIDSLIDEGFDLLDQGIDLSETIHTKLTAATLFERVIGFNTVEIKIYKIEDARRYRINWSEVIKSSGGEGFVSAFIVLTCLLQFMRKEDQDIMRTKNEGKVLLMDNPFAVLQSEHLIKPMMDLAKKTNTQLICLSAVNAVSIYFDNVYVLSIHSNIWNGKDLLTAKQTKGQAELKASNIQAETVEQVRLF